MQLQTLNFDRMNRIYRIEKEQHWQQATPFGGAYLIRRFILVIL
jgi:hypothetical protein